jgi:hypothetical protein
MPLLQTLIATMTCPLDPAPQEVDPPQHMALGQGYVMDSLWLLGGGYPCQAWWTMIQEHR